MEQLKGFHNFDQEQSWKAIARQRHQKGIKALDIPETQEWLFSTDLDEEIDSLSAKLEVSPCY